MISMLRLVKDIKKNRGDTRASEMYSLLTYEMKR